METLQNAAPTYSCVLFTAVKKEPSRAPTEQRTFSAYLGVSVFVERLTVFTLKEQQKSCSVQNCQVAVQPPVLILSETRCNNTQWTKGIKHKATFCAFHGDSDFQCKVYISLRLRAVISLMIFTHWNKYVRTYQNTPRRIKAPFKPF